MVCGVANITILSSNKSELYEKPHKTYEYKPVQEQLWDGLKNSSAIHATCENNLLQFASSTSCPMGCLCSALLGEWCIIAWRVCRRISTRLELKHVSFIARYTNRLHHNTAIYKDLWLTMMMDPSNITIFNFDICTQHFPYSGNRIHSKSYRYSKNQQWCQVNASGYWKKTCKPRRESILQVT